MKVEGNYIHPDEKRQSLEIFVVIIDTFLSLFDHPCFFSFA